MRIQVINYNNEKTGEEITYTKIASPRSLDEFDINIIDLSNNDIWMSDKKNDTVLCINDFLSVKQMVSSCIKAITVFVLPQDLQFKYYPYGNSLHTIRLKDMLEMLRSNILSRIFPFFDAEIVFENTSTRVGNAEYHASFFFKRSYGITTKSESSEKPTTILTSERVYATTLDICGSDESIKEFVIALFFKQRKETVPGWMQQVVFADDQEQMNIINENEKTIEESKIRIEEARGKLAENNKYKSILYTNGDELVTVVFDILEQLLSYDLSEFIDNKREDFLVKKENYTLIGEIKGVSSNVRYEHVSQIETHYRLYLDQLDEDNKEERIKQLLIINPLRTTPLAEREPVHENQIALARRNGSLIIETKVLLRLYERFLKGTISQTQCEALLTERTGILKEDDFCKDGQREDLSPYMV